MTGKLYLDLDRRPSMLVTSTEVAFLCALSGEMAGGAWLEGMPYTADRCEMKGFTYGGQLSPEGVEVLDALQWWERSKP